MRVSVGGWECAIISHHIPILTHPHPSSPNIAHHHPHPHPQSSPPTQTQEAVQHYLTSGTASTTVKQMFTETYIRRLSTLPPADEEEQL